MTRDLHGRIEKSTERRLLKGFLHQRLITDEAEIVTYQELSGVIGGRNVQAQARGLLNGARKDFTAEFRKLTDIVTNKGVKLSDDLEGYLHGQKQRCGRLARRATRQAVYVLEGDDLSDEERSKALEELAMIGAMELFSRPKAKKLIAGRIDVGAPKELPPLEVLKAQFENPK